MDRLIGTAVLLLALVVALPALATLAQTAIPALIGLVVLLGITKLAWPIRRRR